MFHEQIDRLAIEVVHLTCVTGDLVNNYRDALAVFLSSGNFVVSEKDRATLEGTSTDFKVHPKK